MEVDVARLERDLGRKSGSATQRIGESTHAGTFVFDHPRLVLEPFDGVDIPCGRNREVERIAQDFGLYADHVPANFTFIGNGVSGGPGGIPLHSHDYDFNDAILPIGIRYYQALATLN